MPVRLRVNQKVLPENHGHAIDRRLRDRDARERIRRMIPERIEKARQLAARHVVTESEHREQARERDREPLRLARRAVRSGQRLEINRRNFPDRSRDRVSGEFARERRELRVARLRAELENVDELRAQPRIARLEHARRVFVRTALHTRHPDRASQRSQNQREKTQRQPEPHRRGQMQQHIRRKRTQQPRTQPAPRPQHDQRPVLLLQRAIRRREPRGKAIEFRGARAPRIFGKGRAHRLGASNIRVQYSTPGSIGSRTP